MSLGISRRLAILAVPAALLVVAVASAHADFRPAGVVSVTANGSSGSAQGACAYTATLPSTSGFNYISVAFSGSAAARSTSAAAISTSIHCYLKDEATGSAGITLPGPTAAIVGRGEVYRLAADPQVCAVTSAAFSDGTTAPPTEVCQDL